MATSKEKKDMREKVINTFESLIDLIKKFLYDKGEENLEEIIDTRLLISKLNTHIDKFQLSKIQGLRMFNKHIKGGFNPSLRDAEQFIKQVKELSEIFDPSKPEKIKRIVEIIQNVTNNVIKYSYEEWAHKYSKKLVETAKRVQRVAEYMGNLGDLDGIYNYYSNLLNEFGDTKIGRLLEKNGKNEFQTEYEKIQEIYFMK